MSFINCSITSISKIITSTMQLISGPSAKSPDSIHRYRITKHTGLVKTIKSSSAKSSTSDNGRDNPASLIVYVIVAGSNNFQSNFCNHVLTPVVRLWNWYNRNRFVSIHNTLCIILAILIRSNVRTTESSNALTNKRKKRSTSAECSSSLSRCLSKSTYSSRTSSCVNLRKSFSQCLLVNFLSFTYITSSHAANSLPKHTTKHASSEATPSITKTEARILVQAIVLLQCCFFSCRKIGST